MLVHTGHIRTTAAGAHSCASTWLGVRLCSLQCGGVRMMVWLDRFPLVLLIAIALWLAVAPIVPEPHLVEKLRMLS